jgi:hypothetical protein
MTLSIRLPQEQDARLLEQKDKLKALYELLQDIPEEKTLFLGKKEGRDEATLYDDPALLRWMAVRIKDRIGEANRLIKDALTRVHAGELDLSHKNLCDLTMKDFYEPLCHVLKVNLSGNFLRTMPPFMAFKPFIEKLDAVGNLADIEVLFNEFRRQNRVNLDQIEALKALAAIDDETEEQYRTLLTEIRENPLKAPISELAHRVHLFLKEHPFQGTNLIIHPEYIGGLAYGGIKGFFPLNNFSNIETLDLGHCELEHRSPLDWLSPLRRLRVLKLNHTSIKEIPPSLLGKPLVSLDLSSTSITSIPDWLGSITTLKELFLEQTALTHLPASLAGIVFDHLNLNGSQIKTWPDVHLDTQEVSIRGTAIKEIPFKFFYLLKNGQIDLDETNQPTLVLQRQVSRHLQSRQLARIVYSAELYKRGTQGRSTACKTCIVGLEYIALIVGLGLIQVIHALYLPFPMMCSKRQGRKATEFERFQTEKEELRVSLCCLYILFHAIPLKKRAQDMRSLWRFIKN